MDFFGLLNMKKDHFTMFGNFSLNLRPQVNVLGLYIKQQGDASELPVATGGKGEYQDSTCSVLLRTKLSLSTFYLMGYQWLKGQ